MPDGKLRHYIKDPDDDNVNDDLSIQKLNKDTDPMFYDHDQGQYCMDKVCFDYFYAFSILLYISIVMNKFSYYN